MASGCAEVYHSIDSKKIHAYDNFSGYLLSYLQHEVFSHTNLMHVKDSPFNPVKKGKTLKLLSKIRDSY
jgi:hypothetical protein